jgi:hypothetical protein
VEGLKTLLAAMRGEVGALTGLPLQVALLQQRVDDMREGWKTWAQRLWMILGPLLGAVVGASLTYYFNKK